MKSNVPTDLATTAVPGAPSAMTALKRVVSKAVGDRKTVAKKITATNKLIASLKTLQHQ